MLIDLRRVAPGELPDDVFAEFVADNNYSPEMVAALRDHLVNGMTTKDAIKKHGVLPNKLKMRLQTLTSELRKVGKIMAMLTEQSTSTQVESQAKPQDPIEAAYQLSKALTEQLEELRQQHAVSSTSNSTR